MRRFFRLAAIMINYSLLPYLLIGIALIALLDTFGAVASRKLKFNYGLLSPVSFAIYTVIAYLVSKHHTIDITLCCNILLGMFDATAGWYLSFKLKANTGGTEEQVLEVTAGQRILLMAVIASVFGVIGYMLAHNVTI